MLACYKRTHGAQPGDVVVSCQSAAEQLDKCATLVREAALATIVDGSPAKKNSQPEVDAQPDERSH